MGQMSIVWPAKVPAVQLPLEQIRFWELVIQQLLLVLIVTNTTCKTNTCQISTFSNRYPMLYTLQFPPCTIMHSYYWLGSASWRMHMCTWHHSVQVDQYCWYPSCMYLCPTYMCTPHLSTWLADVTRGIFSFSDLLVVTLPLPLSLRTTVLCRADRRISFLYTCDTWLTTHVGIPDANYK